jgi:putative phosphoribosyl transferase
VLFRDRADAGRRLALAVRDLALSDPVVVGLPRGGVVVAAEVAAALGAPLDVIVVRKLGVPRRPELGMGAIGEGGVRLLNDDVIHMYGVTPDELDDVETAERAELNRRLRAYRGGRDAVGLAGRAVVVVDDGVATGFTAAAACRVARVHRATTVVLAVPVGPPGVETELRGVADILLCLETPAHFGSVGQAYDDFRQTTDAEVVSILSTR